MTPNLLDELEKIVALSEKANAADIFDTFDAVDDFQAASVNFLRTHAPALADMAKRMEAAEEAYRKMLAGIDAEQLVAASKKHGDALSVLKDAGRYRHFRRQIATGRCEILHDLDVGYPLHADDPVGTLERFIDSKLDAAIDATQEGEAG
jgi:hypothetical protein